MNENSSATMGVFLAHLLGAFSLLHPWAATGSVFGCFLFIAMPGKITKFQKLFLSLFSWGAGYGLGVMFYAKGASNEQGAWFVAVGGAALAAAVFSAAYRMIESGGELPPWANALIERVPFFNRKG